MLLHVRTAKQYAKTRSLLTLRDLVARGAPDENTPSGYSMIALEKEMLDNKAAEGLVQIAAADFFDRPDDERGSVLSSARRHLSFIDLFRSEKGRQTLEQPGLSLNALKTRPTTIYLCLPARHIGTCNRWLRLFVNLTLQSMETMTGRLPGGVPVLCVLDEFAALGHMQQVEDAAGQIAGFGVKLWPILQDLAQLKDLYDKRWETFLGNAGVLQFFGNNDLTTLEWIQKRLGRASIEAVRVADISSKQALTSTGESRSTEVYDLLGIDEAARLFRRDDPKLRQLVLWGGNRPLVLQRAFYDQHALCRDNRGRPLFDEPPQ